MSVISSRTQLADVPEEYVRELAAALGEDVEVTTRALDRFAIAIDASHYLAVPQALARPRTAHQVGMAMALAVRSGWPLTFRSGGTSLSGQAISDSILVRLGRGWTDFRVFDQANRIRLQPGMIGS